MTPIPIIKYDTTVAAFLIDNDIVPLVTRFRWQPLGDPPTYARAYLKSVRKFISAPAYCWLCYNRPDAVKAALLKGDFAILELVQQVKRIRRNNLNYLDYTKSNLECSTQPKEINFESLQRMFEVPLETKEDLKEIDPENLEDRDYLEKLVDLTKEQSTEPEDSKPFRYPPETYNNDGTLSDQLKDLLDEL